MKPWKSMAVTLSKVWKRHRWTEVHPKKRGFQVSGSQSCSAVGTEISEGILSTGSYVAILISWRKYKDDRCLCNSLYLIYFKFDISVWMIRKVLLKKFWWDVVEWLERYFDKHRWQPTDEIVTAIAAAIFGKLIWQWFYIIKRAQGLDFLKTKQ